MEIEEILIIKLFQPSIFEYRPPNLDHEIIILSCSVCVWEVKLSLQIRPSIRLAPTWRRVGHAVVCDIISIVVVCSHWCLQRRISPPSYIFWLHLLRSWLVTRPLYCFLLQVIARTAYNYFAQSWIYFLPLHDLRVWLFMTSSTSLPI
jgi:hypothetical protein